MPTGRLNNLKEVKDMAKQKQEGNQKTGKTGFFGKVGGFFKNLWLKISRAFKDMVAELKKVTWPTKQELINYTLVTLAFMAAFVIIIGVQDSISAFLVKLLTNS